MNYTIEETFSYSVKADSFEEALALWERYREAGRDFDDDDATGVSFADNTVKLYDEEGSEL